MNKPSDEALNQAMIENAQLREKLVCRRCGFDNNHDKYEVDQEILKDYYRCMLAQQLFTKTYDIMDGTYSITCQEPNRRLLNAYTGCWDRLDSAITQYAPDMLCLLMVTKIERRTDEGMVTIFELPMDEKITLFRGSTFENIENVIPTSFQELSQILLSAIKGVTAAFSTLCTQLAEAALDENFWKGVGLN